MKFDYINKILTISQTDLEHAGFDWADFEGMLFLNGMDQEEIDRAKKCHTIIVSMHRGLHPECQCK